MLGRFNKIAISCYCLTALLICLAGQQVMGITGNDPESVSDSDDLVASIVTRSGAVSFLTGQQRPDLSVPPGQLLIITGPSQFLDFKLCLQSEDDSSQSFLSYRQPYWQVVTIPLLPETTQQFSLTGQLLDLSCSGIVATDQKAWVQVFAHSSDLAKDKDGKGIVSQSAVDDLPGELTGHNDGYGSDAPDDWFKRPSGQRVAPVLYMGTVVRTLWLTAFSQPVKVLEVTLSFGWQGVGYRHRIFMSRDQYLQWQQQGQTVAFDQLKAMVLSQWQARVISRRHWQDFLSLMNSLPRPVNFQPPQLWRFLPPEQVHIRVNDGPDFSQPVYDGDNETRQRQRQRQSGGGLRNTGSSSLSPRRCDRGTTRHRSAGGGSGGGMSPGDGPSRPVCQMEWCNNPSASYVDVQIDQNTQGKKLLCDSCRKMFGGGESVQQPFSSNRTEPGRQCPGAAPQYYTENSTAENSTTENSTTENSTAENNYGELLQQLQEYAQDARPFNPLSANEQRQFERAGRQFLGRLETEQPGLHALIVELQDYLEGGKTLKADQLWEKVSRIHELYQEYARGMKEEVWRQADTLSAAETFMKLLEKFPAVILASSDFNRWSDVINCLRKIKDSVGIAGGQSGQNRGASSGDAMLAEIQSLLSDPNVSDRDLLERLKPSLSRVRTLLKQLRSSSLPLIVSKALALLEPYFDRLYQAELAENPALWIMDQLFSGMFYSYYENGRQGRFAERPEESLRYFRSLYTEQQVHLMLSMMGETCIKQLFQVLLQPMAQPGLSGGSAPVAGSVAASGRRVLPAEGRHGVLHQTMDMIISGSEQNRALVQPMFELSNLRFHYDKNQVIIILPGCEVHMRYSRTLYATVMLHEISPLEFMKSTLAKQELLKSVNAGQNLRDKLGQARHGLGYLAFNKAQKQKAKFALTLGDEAEITGTSGSGLAGAMDRLSITDGKQLDKQKRSKKETGEHSFIRWLRKK